jgi:hypothetical protein
MELFEEITLCQNTIRLTTESVEMRMSHWVHCPVIYSNKTSRILLNFSHGGWHLDSYVEQGKTLMLFLNQYPDNRTKHRFDIDFSRNIVTFNRNEYMLKKFGGMLEKRGV